MAWYTRPRYTRPPQHCRSPSSQYHPLHMTLLTVLTSGPWTGGTGYALQEVTSRESGHVLEPGPVRHVIEPGPVRHVIEQGPVRHVIEQGPVRLGSRAGPVRLGSRAGPVRHGSIKDRSVMVRSRTGPSCWYQGPVRHVGTKDRSVTGASSSRPSIPGSPLFQGYFP